MPKDREWKTLSEWAKKYGDCVYVDVLGQPIVILDSLAAAHEKKLLDQRSAIYSAYELWGDWFNQGLALTPYSPRFHSLRRLIHKELTGTMLQKYWPLHEEESRTLVERVLLDPGALLDSIRRYPDSVTVILRVTYGYQTPPEHDKFLVLAERLMSTFSQASQPGVWAVDILPFFKQTEAMWWQMNMDFVEGPFEWALTNKVGWRFLMWASASLFGGTVVTLSSFFLAMALPGYPERSTVLTDGRLPQLSDQVLRWNPIGPLGLPHLSTKDDVYRGYHLPAGSIVLANVWSILRDPLVFPAPEEFRPDRFMNDKRALDVVASIFGFGRRTCPGVHFAEASMFIAIATALAQ
ncbi:cytochrome P450 [Mycena epipterygia]|nr:cytochrome P450 [Mycena epipterygia]